MDVVSSFYSNVSTTNNLKPQILECVSFVHIHDQDKRKLNPRFVRSVLLGILPLKKDL